MESNQYSEVDYDRLAKILNAIQAWNTDLSASGRHEEYCKMADSSFSFYQGTDYLFWEDFAGDWRLSRFGNARTKTWLETDAHVDNYGAFCNYKGGVIYGLNDFDESVIADYQYDVWRLAVSIVLVARLNGDLSHKQQENVVNAFAGS